MSNGAYEMAGMAALVWFKRDLSMRDHVPLVEAMHFDSALSLGVVEPQWLQSPECDPRHIGFLRDCVAGLQRGPAARGRVLLVRTGAMPQMLQLLCGESPFTRLFRHEQTGPGSSHEREGAVAGSRRSQGVNRTESPQPGVVRRFRTLHNHGSRKSGLQPIAHKRRPRTAPEGQGQLIWPSLRHSTMVRSS